MKKKSSSQSAFFNFRVLFLLCAVVAVLVFAAFGQRSAQDQKGSLTQAPQPGNNNPSRPLLARQRASSSTFSLMEAPGSNGATVTTDKPDYMSGPHAGVLIRKTGLDRTEIYDPETVVISGTGWTANQEVALHIDDTNEVPRFDATVMADADGNISNSEFVIQPKDVGVAFTLTATQGDVTAWTQFTDVVGAGTAPNGDPGEFEINTSC